ncbi:Alpha/Beta hydrolase protein [Gautieria morchelliformis]|nr:Alpha/Beta hydrolase protein [Gautieria morchelliformis]
MPDLKYAPESDSEILASPRVNNQKRQRFVSYLLYGLVLILSFSHLINTVGDVSNKYTFFRQSVQTRAGFDWEKVVPRPELEWYSCFPNRQCARLEVPLDYNDPSGEKAAIAMIRIKANVSPNSRKYRGPILFNPGGPGGPGVAFVNSLGESFQKLIGEEFDIVGFDPRGVGLTTPPVAIFSDQYERAYWNSGAPPLINSTSDSLLDAYTRSQLLGELSIKRTMHAAEHVSTATVARDMLSITQAHGRDKLMYWGFSYGTVLGATYAALFPDNIERLVIDGVVDFDDYYSGGWSKNLYDTDKILQLLYDECVTAGMSCPLYANSSSLVQRRVENILMSIKASPLPVVDGSGAGYGVVDYTMVKNDLFRALYKPFAELNKYAHVLAAIERGEGRPALAYRQRFESPPSCNSLPTLPTASQDAGVAIRCGDAPGGKHDLPHIAHRFYQLSQISQFADVWVQATGVDCAGWNIEVKNRYEGPFNSTTNFPLLIIGNTADPVTPLIGAQKAAQGFSGSALLTVDTPGHCSLAGTSPSAMGHIRRYFRDGILPPPGTVCEIEDRLFGTPKLGPDGTAKEDKSVVDSARLLSRHFQAMREGYLL